MIFWDRDLPSKLAILKWNLPAPKYQISEKSKVCCGDGLKSAVWLTIDDILMT
jgi:hypothetical protein